MLPVGLYTGSCQFEQCKVNVDGECCQTVDQQRSQSHVVSAACMQALHSEVIAKFDRCNRAVYSHHAWVSTAHSFAHCSCFAKPTAGAVL